jgi:hypothetical protein
MPPLPVTRDGLALLYVDDVCISQEAHASTACYEGWLSSLRYRLCSYVTGNTSTGLSTACNGYSSFSVSIATRLQNVMPLIALRSRRGPTRYLSATTSNKMLIAPHKVWRERGTQPNVMTVLAKTSIILLVSKSLLQNMQFEIRPQQTSLHASVV